MREELHLFVLNLRAHEGSELDGYLSQMGYPGALQAAVQPAHGTRHHGDREGSQLSSRVCRGNAKQQQCTFWERKELHLVSSLLPS